MPGPDPDNAPIACSLSQDDLAGRQVRWRELADRALLDIAATDDGLRMRFRADPGAGAELRELAALERDCCPFADWTVHTDGDAHVMDIRGSSPAAVATVHTMFAELRTPPLASASG
jgi:MerR family transcriptional regulator, copper efflux regulator